MENEIIRLRGAKSDLDNLKIVLENLHGNEQVQVSDPEPYSGDLLDRNPLRQVELFDIVIAIAINLVSSVIYDQLKSIIMEYAVKKKLHLIVEKEKKIKIEAKNSPRGKNRRKH